MKGGRCKQGIILPKGGVSNVQGNSDTFITDEITGEIILAKCRHSTLDMELGTCRSEKIIF